MKRLGQFNLRVEIYVQRGSGDERVDEYVYTDCGGEIRSKDAHTDCDDKIMNDIGDNEEKKVAGGKRDRLENEMMRCANAYLDERLGGVAGTLLNLDEYKRPFRAFLARHLGHPPPLSKRSGSDDPHHMLYEKTSPLNHSKSGNYQEYLHFDSFQHY